MSGGFKVWILLVGEEEPPTRLLLLWRPLPQNHRLVEVEDAAEDLETAVVEVEPQLLVLELGGVGMAVVLHPRANRAPIDFYMS